MHHTLLLNYPRTGVTLQTMHPEHFDQGAIVDQTPAPGLEHQCETIDELSAKLAPLGAEMLLRSIRNGSFVSPVAFPQPESLAPGQRAPRPAPKITSEDRHIDWRFWSADDILRRHRVLGRLWNNVQLPNTATRRLIWQSGFSQVGSTKGNALDKVGKILYSNSSPQAVQTMTHDGTILQAETVKLDGKVERPASEALSLRKNRRKGGPEFKGLVLS